MPASIRINGLDASVATATLGAPVTLQNANNTGVSSISWSASYPQYSDGTSPDFATNWSGWTHAPADKILSINQSGSFSSVAFTPDVPGTYVVNLETSEGLETLTDSVVVRVLASANDQVPPGFGEDKEGDAYGFAAAVNRWLLTSSERRGWIRVLNNSGITIGANRVARVTGFVDYRISEGNSIPSGSATKADYIPTVTINDNSLVSKFVYTIESIANGASGWVLDSGYIVADYTGLTPGVVYSANDGTLTNTETVAPVGTIIAGGDPGYLHFIGFQSGGGSSFSLPTYPSQEVLFGDGTDTPASSDRVLIDTGLNQELLTLVGSSGTTALEISAIAGGGVGNGGLRIGHAPFSHGVVDIYNGSGQLASKLMAGSAGDPSNNQSWIASKFQVGSFVVSGVPDTLTVIGGGTFAGPSTVSSLGDAVTIDYSFGSGNIVSRNSNANAFRNLAVSGDRIRFNTSATGTNTVEFSSSGALLLSNGSSAIASVGTGGLRYNETLGRLQWQEGGGPWQNLDAVNARQVTAGAGLIGGGSLGSNITIDVAAGDGSIVVAADNIRVGVISDSNHGNRGGGTLHATATTSVAGFMSAVDKTKLDNVFPSAIAQGRILYGNGTVYPANSAVFYTIPVNNELRVQAPGSSTGVISVGNDSGNAGTLIFGPSSGINQVDLNSGFLRVIGTAGVKLRAGALGNQQDIVTVDTDGAIRLGYGVSGSSTAESAGAFGGAFRLLSGRIQFSEDGGPWTNLSDLGAGSGPTAGTGITDVSGTWNNDLSTGVDASFQDVIGSTQGQGSLYLRSTTNASKGSVFVGGFAEFDEEEDTLQFQPASADVGAIGNNGAAKIYLRPNGRLAVRHWVSAGVKSVLEEL